MTEIKNTSVIEFSDVSDEQMNQMIDETLTDFNDGDLVKGTVVQIDGDEVLVDIGFKSEGVIPLRELSLRKDFDPSDVVSIGDEIEALVMQKEDKDGRLILSKRRAEYERAWTLVEEKFKAGECITGEVIEIVKGGLIVDIGLRGFLPASLVDLRRVKDLDSYLNTEVDARIIEMDRNRNNVVLSRRVLLEEGRRNERAAVLSKLSKGMRLKGKVSSIVDFGAFVDLGGIDGLVHISELSWDHVTHPSEVVKVGDDVEVVVLDVDANRERISLGLKQTTEDPWIARTAAFPVGSIVVGVVAKIVPFGAFVKLDDSIEGLVHISEMAARHIDSPAQVVKVGDAVRVKVMEANPERHRLSLSMQAAAEDLGFEIEIDESVKPEERPTKRTRKSDSDADTDKTEESEDMTGSEAEAEADVEAEAETEVEAEADVETEAEAEVEAEADTETEAEAEADTETEPEEVTEEVEITEEAPVEEVEITEEAPVEEVEEIDVSSTEETPSEAAVDELVEEIESEPEPELPEPEPEPELPAEEPEPELPAEEPEPELPEPDPEPELPAEDSELEQS